MCGECDSISVYNHPTIFHDIMTSQGIEKFVNHTDDNDEEKNEEKDDDDGSEEIFELQLDAINGEIDDLLTHLMKVVKKIVYF